MNLFPFVSVSTNKTPLVIKVVDEENIPADLLEQLQHYTEVAADSFEINECSDPEVVQFIIPALLEYLEGSDISEESLAIIDNMIVSSAVFLQESLQLVIFVDFVSDDDDSEDDDSEEEEDKSDDWK